MVQPTQPDYPAGNASGFSTPRSRQFSRLREKSMYIRSRFGFAIPRTGYSEHPPEARMARGLAMEQSAATTESSRRIRAAFALGLLGLLAVCVPDRCAGQQPASVQPTVRAPATVPHATVSTRTKAPEDEKKSDLPELSLGECIAIAVERQPALKAVHASQVATAAGKQALQNIRRLGSLVSPDLPIRKEQANRGVIAAAADVQKLHNEVVHDVTRLYYTVVYAKQQEQLADDTVAQVEAFVDIGKKLLNSATPGDMTKAKYNLMILGLTDARKLQGKAHSGVKLAVAGLREVMAVERGFAFQLKDKELPVMAQNVPLTEAQVIDMALDRRPELALAAAAADAFRLEVYAQGQLRFRRSVPTLAGASDLHSRLLPTASRDPGQDYRPEPISPEMPPQVVGSKADRVARVLAYSHRADMVYEKARNLMVLEGEKAFIDFDEAAKSLAISKEGFLAAKDLMEIIREGFDNPNPKAGSKEQLLLGYGKAVQAQADYVEAVFKYLLTLGALERVTAGGVRPAFPGR